MPRNIRRTRFAFPFIIIIAVLLLGLVVMLLWNFIFPSILHAEKISYWQAIALFVLCRILFCGFRRNYGDRRHMWREGAPWRQKWMNMSDEERGKFREEWKKRRRRSGDN